MPVTITGASLACRLADVGDAVLSRVMDVSGRCADAGMATPRASAMRQGIEDDFIAARMEGEVTPAAVCRQRGRPRREKHGSKREMELRAPRLYGCR